MSSDIMEQIKNDITSNKILVYMKGSPDFPQCGFSNAVVQVLNDVGVPFEARDVLANPELRKHVPDYADWPTFPQLFVNGELVGGCDIVMEMHQKGELEPLLKKAVQA